MCCGGLLCSSGMSSINVVWGRKFHRSSVKNEGPWTYMAVSTDSTLNGYW